MIIWEEAAQKGDPVSACYLSRLCQRCRKPDGSEGGSGLIWSRRRKRGFIWLIMNYGLYCYYGKYQFEQDREKGLLLIEKSAEEKLQRCHRIFN